MGKLGRKAGELLGSESVGLVTKNGRSRQFGHMIHTDNADWSKCIMIGLEQLSFGHFQGVAKICLV